ncbi:hypothetical protein EV363DRAFT_1184184, partial [Boletus edulis]
LRRDFASRIPECRYDETDKRTTGNKGMLGRSRDIYHDDFALAERQRRGTYFSVFGSMVASDRFCIVF